MYPVWSISFNFDIDFLGWHDMQFELYTDVNADVTANVENIVKDVTGAAPSSVIKAGDSGTQVVIKTLELDSETRDQVFQAVAEAITCPGGRCSRSRATMSQPPWMQI